MGQTQSLRNRWCSHSQGKRATRELENPLVYWIAWNGPGETAEDRLYTESVLILAYKPIWNCPRMACFDAKKDFAECERRLLSVSGEKRMARLIETIGIAYLEDIPMYRKAFISPESYHRPWQHELKPHLN
ncbi:hypothetical protein [Adonisia turfae]|uniref:hypothetical protein n=1 Tax=Adonisia turfae TaxID=2950184 RepID=UPI003D6E763F